MLDCTIETANGSRNPKILSPGNIDFLFSRLDLLLDSIIDGTIPIPKKLLEGKIPSVTLLTFCVHFKPNVELRVKKKTLRFRYFIPFISLPPLL